MDKVKKELDNMLVEAEDIKHRIEAYGKVAAIYEEYNMLPQLSDINGRVKALESDLNFLRNTWRQLNNSIKLVEEK